MAGTCVINGFGKSAGLLQIDELGTVETPILMTNTLSVGTALNALSKYMLEHNQDIGVSTGTVNCVVTESATMENSNDIRGFHVKSSIFCRRLPWLERILQKVMWEQAPVCAVWGSKAESALPPG